MKRCLVLLLLPCSLLAQTAGNHKAAVQPVDQVNVFLGSSGDHGQLSPAASYPFGMMSIGPQTYPNAHMGYEHNAKRFLGFTHNRFEGVGCMGSGGNLLVKPFLGNDPQACELIKATEIANPGYYSVGFANQIKAEFAVCGNQGVHHYRFPAGDKGFLLDLAHTLSNKFVNEEHTINGTIVSGWVESTTTCNVGVYRVYYYLFADRPVEWKEGEKHTLTAMLAAADKEVSISVGFSAVSAYYAREAATGQTFAQCKQSSRQEWNRILSRIQVKGDAARENLFYSLFYRTVQSPYNITEKDGNYRGNDGSLQHTDDTAYNGWAIWDNYRTQLPLLSIAFPEKYKGIAASVANLYKYGKKDYATLHEPSNSVRTEHAIVVLLDAYRKGYMIAFDQICDSLLKEVDALDYSHPDKALESSYDAWALSQILAVLDKKALSEQYRQKALQYRDYWNKEFKDLDKPDVDKMQARGMYQGTIWQYRWFVPFDVKGLIHLTGGEEAYRKQLDRFFENDYYNHANEPDIQVPYLYNASAEPWKSQALVHKYAVDTVVQYYFNDNSRGIDPFVDRIYKNQPDAYIRTMDDDAGAMSAWFVFAAAGLSPACVGWPVYYLNTPLFKSVVLQWPGRKAFHIQVINAAPDNKYIKEVRLNGSRLNRLWITHQEIMAGGRLEIVAAAQLEKENSGMDKWISDIEAAAK
jgi:putative alpha-1,2-mannosidase